MGRITHGLEEFNQDNVLQCIVDVMYDIGEIEDGGICIDHDFA